jgi:hypothetical protein
LEFPSEGRWTVNGVLISATGQVALCDICVEIPATVVHENTYHVCPECLGHLAAAGSALERVGLTEMDSCMAELYRAKAHCKRKFTSGGAA